jgi:hypothetical protein
MGCFLFGWNERGSGGIPKNRLWNSDLSSWSRSRFKTSHFSADCIARREACGSSIGFYEILAMMPTYSIAIKWMKKLS